MNIQSLRKKARDGSLEVEHVLQAAIERQPGLAEELSSLSEKHAWQFESLQPDGRRVVPFARWALVAASYVSGGFPELYEILDEPDNLPFVLGLVASIKTSESVVFILDICNQYLKDDPQSTIAAFQIASSFNLLLSFKHAPVISAQQAKSIQDFLFALYPLAKSQVDRATVLLALRGVGDHNVMAFVETAADFTDPWADTKQVVIQAIRKKMQLTVRQNKTVRPI
jgi:hypothetical protein